MPHISVIVPVHDEADSLEPLYLELDAAVGRLPGAPEIVLVDDASRDGSLATMRRLAEKDPRVRIVALDRHSGQSAALDAGFRAARGEILVTLDADLQNDPADIPRLLDALAYADVVNGVRMGRRDGWQRRAASKLANAVRNALTGEQVTDVGCSLRAMRAEYVRRVRMFRGMHRFLPTLLRMEGARVAEIPVGHRARRFGRSKYGIRDRALVGLVDCLAVRWMQRRVDVYRPREVRVGEGEGEPRDALPPRRWDDPRPR